VHEEHMTAAKRSKLQKRKSLKTGYKIRKNEKANSLVEIKVSNIPQAGFGAFARKHIPARTTLGEYKGKIMTKKEYEALDDNKCSYIFQINRKISNGKRRDFFIDARFKKHSNWTRFVNGAKSKEQREGVNVEAYQYGGKLFYRTSTEVDPCEELLVDYGSDYWTSDEEEESSSSEEEEEEEDSEEEGSEEEEEEEEDMEDSDQEEKAQDE